MPKPNTVLDGKAKAMVVVPQTLRNFGEAYRAGVKIAFGTDTALGENGKEFALMVNAGKAMSKSELFFEVWGYEFIGGTNLVEVTVRRVREKIEPDPSQPVYLLTVRGAGYRFVRPDEPVGAAGRRP